MVLVVADHDDIRRVICLLLQRDGYEVEGVASGEAALSFLQTRLPGCVLLDLNMPGDVDGFEVLRRVRADPGTRHVRIIVHSAYDGQLRARVVALGADDFVRKGSLSTPG